MRKHLHFTLGWRLILSSAGRWSPAWDKPFPGGHWEAPRRVSSWCWLWLIGYIMSLIFFLVESIVGLGPPCHASFPVLIYMDTLLHLKAVPYSQGLLIKGWGSGTCFTAYTNRHVFLHYLLWGAPCTKILLLVNWTKLFSSLPKEFHLGQTDTRSCLLQEKKLQY